MKWLKTVLVLSICSTTLLAADWPSIGGNAQRDGWSRGEKTLSKESAANIKFLYTYKTGDGKKLNDATTPVVLSNIITYKGFKHLVTVGTSKNAVVSLDADIGKVFYDTKLTTGEAGTKVKTSATCPGGLTANLAFPGNSLAAGRFGGPSVNRVGRVAKGQPPPFHFSFASPIYAISADGVLHTVVQLSGITTTAPPVKFLPPNARATGINVDGDRVFVATVGNCAGAPNGIYSVDPAAGTVVSFLTNGSGPTGNGGTTMGTDGVVYAQITSGHGDVAGDYNDSLLALSPDKLAVQDYFTPSGPAAKVDAADVSGVTPTLFGLEQKDWIVTAGHDGRIYILDADSLGGADHHTPAFRSDVIVTPSKTDGFRNNFATYLDDKGVRWVFAAVRGKVANEFPTKNGDAATGSIVAFKLTFDSGKPTLTPAWQSRDMVSPSAPAIINGLVVALSTGESIKSKKGAPAILYVMDADTGKQIYAGDKATTYSTGGVAVANAQIYFATHDGTLYAYGIPLER
jgi:hypothetical protein